MGIRFTCQHCQRQLNVKTVQAGQAGECPHCHQSIVVPGEPVSDPPVATSNADSVAAVLDVDSQITQVGLNPSISLDPETPLGGFSVPLGLPKNPEKVVRSLTKLEDADSFLLDKPQPPSSLGKIDPIQEEPRKVWYYRSKKLGEKGPLRAKVMQEELDNGHCTIGCIVWREDWEDWQPAEKVFPSLVALVEKSTAQKLMRDANSAIPDDLNPHSALQRRQRRLQLFGMVAIACGLIVIAALVYYLINLLSK